MTHLPNGPVHGCWPPRCHVIMAHASGLTHNGAVTAVAFGVGLVLGVCAVVPVLASLETRRRRKRWERELR